MNTFSEIIKLSVPVTGRLTVQYGIEVFCWKDGTYSWDMQATIKQMISDVNTCLSIGVFPTRELVIKTSDVVITIRSEGIDWFKFIEGNSFQLSYGVYTITVITNNISDTTTTAPVENTKNLFDSLPVTSTQVVQKPTVAPVVLSKPVTATGMTEVATDVKGDLRPKVNPADRVVTEDIIAKVMAEAQHHVENVRNGATPELKVDNKKLMNKSASELSADEKAKIDSYIQKSMGEGSIKLRELMKNEIEQAEAEGFKIPTTKPDDDMEF